MTLRTTVLQSLVLTVIFGLSACTNTQDKNRVTKSSQKSVSTSESSPATSLSDTQLSALALTEVDKQLEADDQVLPAAIGTPEDTRGIIKVMIPMLRKMEGVKLNELLAEAIKFVDKDGDAKISPEEVDATVTLITEKSKQFRNRSKEWLRDKPQDFCLKIVKSFKPNDDKGMDIVTTIYAPIAARHCMDMGDGDPFAGGNDHPKPFDFAGFCEKIPGKPIPLGAPDQLDTGATTEVVDGTEEIKKGEIAQDDPNQSGEEPKAVGAAEPGTTVASDDKPAVDSPFRQGGKPFEAWMRMACRNFGGPGAEPRRLPPIIQIEPPVQGGPVPGPDQPPVQACCMSTALECMACAAGLTEKEYCAQNAKQAGCDALLKK